MKIGILSSGGDCPGINATIRGVGKCAMLHFGMEVIGIHSGFKGLLEKDTQVFDERSLSGILNLGNIGGLVFFALLLLTIVFFCNKGRKAAKN